MAEPSQIPLQVVFIELIILIVAVAGCVIIKATVEVHPMASVIVKLRGPAHKFVPVGVVCAFDHK